VRIALSLLKAILYLVITVLGYYYLLPKIFVFVDPLYKWFHTDVLWVEFLQVLRNHTIIVFLTNYILFAILSKILPTTHPLILAGIATILVKGIPMPFMMFYRNDSLDLIGFSLLIIGCVLLFWLTHFLPYASKDSLIIRRSFWIALPVLIVTIIPISNLWLGMIGVEKRHQLAIRSYGDTYIESRNFIENCSNFTETYGELKELDLVVAQRYALYKPYPEQDFYTFKFLTSKDSGFVHPHPDQNKLRMSLDSEHSFSDRRYSLHKYLDCH